MKVRKCVSCGAPLGEVDPDAVSARCEFCGAVNETTVLRRGVQQVQIILQPRRRQVPPRASGIGVVVAIVVMIGVAGAAAAAVFGVWSGLRAALPGKLPRLPGEKVWTPANLADLPARGRLPLEISPPPGGYAKLDPVAAIPWAAKAAQGWAPDARLVRIDVTRMLPDGIVDTAGDAEAEVVYRFISPARAAQYWKEADQRTNVTAHSEMWVIAKAGEAFVQALTSTPSREAAPPAPDALPLPNMMQKVRGKLPAVPFFRGYMIHSAGEGWVWYLSTLSGRESIPRIRAADGRQWPYTGAAAVAA